MNYDRRGQFRMMRCRAGLLLTALGAACAAPDGARDLDDEDRQGVALQSFAEPVQIGGGGQKVTFAGDFDDDGRVDVGLVEGDRPTLAFGEGFATHTIDDTPLDWSGAGVVADFDGDGDLDVGFGDDGYATGTPGAWRIYRNPGHESAASSAWPRTTAFDLNPANHLNDAATGDLDGDGKIDLVARSRAHDHRFIVSMNNRIDDWDTVTFSPSQYNQRGPEGVAVGDVTGDGRPDVVADGYFFYSADWRSGVATEVVFSPDWVREKAKMWVDDINADGRNDIIITKAEGGSKRLSWIEAPADPIGGTWTEHVIHNDNGQMHFLQTADMDGDGDPDIVTGGFRGTGSGDGIKIYYNRNDGQSWTRDDMSTYGIYHGAVIDFDGDGDLDILGIDGYNRRLYYHENVSSGAEPPGDDPPPPPPPGDDPPPPPPGGDDVFRLEGETYDADSGGLGVYGGGTGQKLGSARNGDWARFDGVDLRGVTSLEARVSSRRSAGTIEVRVDGRNGAKIAEIDVPATGSWESWRTITAAVDGDHGIHDLFLVWTAGSGGWGDVDYVDLLGGT